MFLTELHNILYTTQFVSTKNYASFPNAQTWYLSGQCINLQRAFGMHVSVTNPLLPAPAVWCCSHLHLQQETGWRQWLDGQSHTHTAASGWDPIAVVQWYQWTAGGSAESCCHLNRAKGGSSCPRGCFSCEHCVTSPKAVGLSIGCLQALISGWCPAGDRDGEKRTPEAPRTTISRANISSVLFCVNQCNIVFCMQRTWLGVGIVHCHRCFVSP